MTAKEELHRLVNELSENEARLWLEALRTRDPLLLKLLTAPYDDEPETDEERAAIQKARDQLARGEMIPDDELWRRLGHGPVQR